MKADRLFLSEADYDQPVSVDDDAMQARNIPSIPAEGIDLPRMKGSFLMMITSIVSRKRGFVTVSLALGLALAFVGLTAFFLTSPPIHAHAANSTYTLSVAADPQGEAGYVLVTVSPLPQKNLLFVDAVKVKGQQDVQVKFEQWPAQSAGSRELLNGAGVHTLYLADADSHKVVSNGVEIMVDQDGGVLIINTASVPDESVISSLPTEESSPVEDNPTVVSSSTDS